MKRLSEQITCIAAFAFYVPVAAQASEIMWTEMMKAGKTAQYENNLPKAEKLFERALKEAEADRAEESQTQSLLWLARVYAAQEKYDLAETTLRSALVKAEKLSGRLDPWIEEGIRNELLKLLKRQNKFAGTSGITQSTEKIDWQKQEARAKSDPFELGLRQFQIHNYPKSIPLLERVFKCYTTEPEIRSDEANECIDMLYQMYRDAKAYDKAEKLLVSALDVSKTESGEERLDSNVMAGKLFLYLAGLYAIQGQELEAETMANRGFTICFAHHNGTNISLDSLLKHWTETGRQEEAKAIDELYDRFRFAATKPKREKRSAQNLEWEDDTSKQSQSSN